MTYARTPVLIQQQPLTYRPALSGIGGVGAPVLIAGTLVVVSLVALGIYFAVKGAKSERELKASIVAKDGAAGLEKYEAAKTKRAAVEGGLGILSGLAWGGGNGMHHNKGRKRARKTSRR